MFISDFRSSTCWRLSTGCLFVYLSIHWRCNTLWDYCLVPFDVNYNLISVLNCISYLVTQNFDPPFRLRALEVEANETRVECQSPRAIRNLNTLSSTARRTFISFFFNITKIGNVWNTRRGSVKVLKSWAHTRHTTRKRRSADETLRRRRPQNVLFGF